MTTTPASGLSAFVPDRRAWGHAQSSGANWGWTVSSVGHRAEVDREARSGAARSPGRRPAGISFRNAASSVHYHCSTCVARAESSCSTVIVPLPLQLCAYCNTRIASAQHQCVVLVQYQYISSTIALPSTLGAAEKSSEIADSVLADRIPTCSLPQTHDPALDIALNRGPVRSAQAAVENPRLEVPATSRWPTQG